MVEIIFLFQYKETKIQGKGNEKLKEIFQKFANNIGKDINSLNFFYQSLKINNELTFFQVANKEDLKRNKMDILVYEKDLIKSKEIICPECNENIRINFNNYKISLFDCKNKHKINNIFFNEFNKT